MTDVRRPHGHRVADPNTVGPAREPLAIVGIGCRFPGGARDPESFWQLLRDGVDAIGEVPPDRWDVDAIYHSDRAAPGRTYAKWGGFIDGVDQFDASFFGISPREAASMDPQTRLLLEVAAEALADGGQAPERRADRTGVFVGISGSDYQDILLADRRSIDGYTATGSAMSIAANRISHAFDFHGPSLALDTACSSSLVAVHLAAQSLWSGECELALAGGVCLLLRPEMTIGFSKGFMLSPDGRCKAFDARANGFVRGEGAGLVVLKPLSVARREGDRVYGVVLATNVNQDGHTPTGIAVPNPEAQVASLRSAYSKAGVEAHQVDYVEAHGPGTPVGDPIEVGALGTVLGVGREKGRELIVGSVKTNIGHLEPAAGIAGLIKTALALHHRAIPKNLHFASPNPAIPFEELGVRVSQELTRWEPNGHSRVAGVNSFGFGGTNAHTVLGGAEYAPAPEPVASEAPSKATLVPLSAATETALRAVAESWSGWLESTPATLSSLAATQAHRRSPMAHRLAVVARSRDELRERLRAVAEGETAPGVFPGRSSRERLRVAFVYCGMGSHWWAMGRELMEEEPEFRAALDDADRCFAALTSEWSLIEELQQSRESSRIERFDIAQPAMFAIQVAMTRLMRARGVQPDAIIGHSVGEAAAAYAAGVLSLEDAAAVVFHRSRLQVLTQGKGGLLAVELSEDDVRPFLQGRESGASVAAVNSPGTVTLAGDRPTLEAIAAQLEARDVFHRFLRADVPAHSSKMDPFIDELVESVRDVRPLEGELPLYSTVLGARIEPDRLGASYWGDNFRQPVRFADAVGASIDDGIDCFVEIAPHRVLSPSVTQIGAARGIDVRAVPTMLRETSERETLLGAIGELWAAGCAVDLSAVIADAPLVRLPAYPWERQRHWNEPSCSARSRLPSIARALLGRRVDSPTPTWELRLDEHNHEYLYDHDVQGAVIFPAAGFAEMAMSAAAELAGDGPVLVEDLHLEKALFMPPSETVLVRITVDADGAFVVHGRPEGEESWCRHARGRVERWPDREHAGGLDTAAIADRCPRFMSTEDFYAKLGRMGDDFGPMFQGVLSVRRGEGEALAEIEVPEPLRKGLSDYCVHPALLDACFQSIIANLPRAAEGSALPIHLRELRVLRPATTSRYRAHSRLVATADGGFVGDLDVIDEEGRRILEVRDFTFQSLESRETGSSRVTERGIVHRYRWEYAPRDVARPRRFPAFAPSPSALANVLDLEPIVQQFGRAAHDARHRPALASLACSYISEALRELGADLATGSLIDPQEIIERHPLDALARCILLRFFEVLAEAGILREKQKVFQVVEAPGVRAEVLLRTLSHTLPEYDAELTLVARAGPELAAVLRGEVDPLTLLFPNGLLEDAARLYEHAPTALVYNRILVHAVRAMLHEVPEGRRLRVLEVGAGTGGTAAHVLAGVDPDQIEYVFTDVSPAFLARAQEELGRHSVLDFRVLDLERDPLEQGFDLHSFDLVIAADVVHATRSVVDTLDRIRGLMASEGRLLLLELTNAPAWVDVTFGLLDGWWSFEDQDLRQGSPLLGAESWRRLLRARGFDDVAVLTDTDPATAEQCVLLGRGPRIPEADIDAAGDVPKGEGNWLLLADEGGVAEALAEGLREAGRHVLLGFTSDPDEIEGEDRIAVRSTEVDDLARAVRTAGHAGGLEGVVYLGALDLPRTEVTSLRDLETACERGPGTVTALVQALGRQATSAPPRLWIVTDGADALQRTADRTAAVQAGVWGIARVVANEHPELRCSVIDVGDSRSPSDLRGLCDELLADDAEDALALRDGERYVQRWETTSLFDAPAPPGDEVARVLSPGGRVAEQELVPLTSGQVRIRVHALAGGRGTRGDEETTLARACAGVVAAVGTDVSLVPGDRVVALSDTVATQVVVDAALVAPMPEHLGFAAAATLPLPLVMTRAAFAGLAEVVEGQRVLLHGGWSDVGLAALRHCVDRGAQVLATVRDEGDAGLLLRLGAKAVVSRDTLDLARWIEGQCSTSRMDVVFCAESTAGARVSPSWVADGGAFLCVDPAPDEGVDAVANGTARVVHSRRLIEQTPERAGELLRAALREVVERQSPGLVHTTASFADGCRAARRLEQASHRGALVLSTTDLLLPRPAAAGRRLHLREDATYLITGGLGGFGLELSRWLVERGARHLALLGRSGVDRPAAKAAVEALRERGAEVTVLRADVSDSKSVAHALAMVAETMPPLRGVVHAAMFLRDAVLDQLDPQTLRAVWLPKVAGAFALHQQTRGLDLDFFVPFASFAGLVGNPGQGAYAAANAALDALAAHRRLQGEVATAIDWGSIASVGYVSERADIAAHLERIGVEPIDVGVALEGFGELIGSGVPQAAFIAVDFARWCRAHAAGATPRFERIRELHAGEDVAEGEAATSAEAVLAALRRAPADEQQQMLEDRTRQAVARALRMPVSDVVTDRSLIDLGFDSLMAVELRVRLNEELGLDVPTLKIMRGPSVQELAGILQAALSPEVAGDITAPAPTPPRDWLVVQHPRPEAERRLICFPYNGGTAATYHDWGRQLPAEVEVAVVRIPGQLDRPDEVAPESIPHLVKQLVEGLDAQQAFDRPFAFYGHSLGALVAFELAAQLERVGRGGPEHLFVGACHAPCLDDPFPSPDRLTDRGTLEALGMAEALAPVLDDRQFLADIQPVVEQGMRWIKAYRHGGDVLSCPITAFGGDTDDVVRSEHVAAWRAMTREGFAELRIVGSHLFVEDAAERVLSAISDAFLRGAVAAVGSAA